MLHEYITFSVLDMIRSARNNHMGNCSVRLERGSRKPEFMLLDDIPEKLWSKKIEFCSRNLTKRTMVIRIAG